MAEITLRVNDAEHLLHWAALHWAALHWAALHWAALHWAALTGPRSTGPPTRSWRCCRRVRSPATGSWSRPWKRTRWRSCRGAAWAVQIRYDAEDVAVELRNVPAIPKRAPHLATSRPSAAADGPGLCTPEKVNLSFPATTCRGDLAAGLNSADVTADRVPGTGRRPGPR